MMSVDCCLLSLAAVDLDVHGAQKMIQSRVFDLSFWMDYKYCKCLRLTVFQLLLNLVRVSLF